MFRSMLTFTATSLLIVGLPTVSTAQETAEVDEQVESPNTAMTGLDFTLSAASSDEYERQSGQIATQRGQREQVRALGQQLIVDHTQTTVQLTQAATEAGLPPPVPKLHPGLQRKLQLLRDIPAELFDREFLQQQAEAHVDALELMRTYARVGQEAPLRAVAAAAAPIIRGHLDHTLGLQRSYQ
jgi:putative membrane protein